MTLFGLPQKGFTLSELLIALAILGLIATFTIPKILQSTQTQSRDAVLKETVATLSDILYQGTLSGELTSANINEYFLSRLNAVEVCDTNANAQDCWDLSEMGTGNSALPNTPGVVLPNGAVIVGFENSVNAEGERLLDIDSNGVAGPNINATGVNSERILVSMCIEGASCAFVGNLGNPRPGVLGPGGNNNTLDVWRSLF